MNESEILSGLLNIVESSQWINLSLLGYFMIVIGGGIVLQGNLLKILLCDLKCNGVLYFLLQLFFADAILLFICFFDVTALSHEWIFGNDMCCIFILLSSFASSATVYFVLTINLHAISMANLALNMSHVIQSKEEKNDFLADDFDSCSGTYDTLEHKRTLTIDYSTGSRWKTSVNVFVPNLIVWLIAFFVSMPTFVIFISTKDNELCIPKKITSDVMSIVGFSEIIMISIKTIVPVCLLLFTLFIVWNKLKKVKNVDESLVDENPRKILKFAIFMSSIFMIFQAPKICLDAVILFLDDYNFRILKSAICMIFYFGVTVRLAATMKLIKVFFKN